MMDFGDVATVRRDGPWKDDRGRHGRWGGQEGRAGRPSVTRQAVE